MAYSTTLPLMAGLALFGSAGGVWLGRSAIGEIDPAYFSAPAERFHGDQVPYRSPEWAQVQAAEYQQPAAVDGLGTGCIGCGARADIVYAAPPITTYSAGWSTQATAAAEPAPVAEAAAPDPDLERVVRYASYAVSSEEAARIAQAEEQAQAEAEPEAYASVELDGD